MNKLTNRVYIILLCVLISACEQQKSVPLQKIPEIMTIVSESVENKNKAVITDKENVSLQSQLSESKQKVAELTSKVKELTLDKNDDVFWKEIESSIDQVGITGFFTMNDSNSYAFIRYFFKYQNAYRSSYDDLTVYRPTFPKIEGQVSERNAPWELTKQLKDFSVSFGKNPKMLLTLVEKYGTKFNKLLPLDRKIELKALIAHYTDLLEIAQSESFKQLAQEIINTEAVYADDQDKILSARQALKSQFPRYSLQELQAAYRHLTKNQDDWLALAKEVTQTLEL